MGGIEIFSFKNRGILIFRPLLKVFFVLLLNLFIKDIKVIVGLSVNILLSFLNSISSSFICFLTDISLYLFKLLYILSINKH
jgi:hypothetical protein